MDFEDRIKKLEAIDGDFENDVHSGFYEALDLCTDMLEIINQLRYERLMAKVRYFGILAYHYACEGEGKDSKKVKCTRIAEAYKARAKKIKDGK